jgi:hypothetical protein
MVMVMVRFFVSGTITAALDQKTFTLYIYIYILVALGVNGSICIELIVPVVSLTSWITIVGFYLSTKQ